MRIVASRQQGGNLIVLKSGQDYETKTKPVLEECSHEKTRGRIAKNRGCENAWHALAHIRIATYQTCLGRGQLIILAGTSWWPGSFLWACERLYPWEKTKIGEMKGGFGNKVGDIVIKGDLSATLREVFKAALERAGYTVVTNAPVSLEAEIREFLVFGNGWSQGAREKIRLLLRRSDGNVLWEHGVKGEDGGMVWMVSSYEKSMNVALTRLLTEAMEEFTSELFYQSVKKENSKIP